MRLGGEGAGRLVVIGRAARRLVGRSDHADPPRLEHRSRVRTCQLPLVAGLLPATGRLEVALPLLGQPPPFVRQPTNLVRGLPPQIALPSRVRRPTRLESQEHQEAEAEDHPEDPHVEPPSRGCSVTCTTIVASGCLVQNDLTGEITSTASYTLSGEL